MGSTQHVGPDKFHKDILSTRTSSILYTRTSSILSTRPRSIPSTRMTVHHSTVRLTRVYEDQQAAKQSKHHYHSEGLVVSWHYGIHAPLCNIGGEKVAHSI